MKTEIAERITNQIIEQLEKGVVPWKRPWSVDGLMPTSGSSHRPYRGINTMVLGLTQNVMGYSSAYWYTFRQIQKMGGKVTKGSKGTSVVFWNAVDKEQDGEVSSFIISRLYTVFNFDQTEGIQRPDVEHLDESITSNLEQHVLGSYSKRPAVNYAQQPRAYYSVRTDEIVMPPRSSFDSTEAHLGTLFHELVHSTGHESRLCRFDENGFDDGSYAEEELVAELGSAMLAGMFDVKGQFEQSASYIHGWLRALQNDRQIIIKAAQKAQKGVDLIVGNAVSTEMAKAA